MDIGRVIHNYVELANRPEFRSYCNSFTQSVEKSLYHGYQKNDREPIMVQDIERLINAIDALKYPEDRFNISTNGVFIHGNKSQVKFNYNGNETQRELGDLIFIASVVFNGLKCFEKMTITQFKKSKEKPRWYFNSKDDRKRYPDREQLYLLSNFPSFTGVKGLLFPEKKYDLQNHSGGLGTYGLLYQPGSFAFLSARIVHLLLTGRKSLDFDAITKPNILTTNYISNQFNVIYPLYEKELSRIFNIYSDEYTLSSLYFLCPFFPIFGNALITLDIQDFVKNYLSLRIGETIYSMNKLINKSGAKFLRDIIGSLKSKVDDEKYRAFVNSYYNYHNREIEQFNDNERTEWYGEGGIGIVYTEINLGE